MDNVLTSFLRFRGVFFAGIPKLQFRVGGLELPEIIASIREEGKYAQICPYGRADESKISACKIRKTTAVRSRILSKLMFASYV